MDAGRDLVIGMSDGLTVPFASAASATYRLGLALVDLSTPDQCKRRGNEWVFAPEEPFEIRGDVDNVVFPFAYTIAPYGETVRLYYGAAGTSIALATGSIRGMLEWLDEHS